jgi:AbrB family looped-hinge helix DNA binding protein
MRPVALAQSKLTSQGQISVPAEIRKKLGVGTGSVLEWEADGDRVVVRRAGRYSSAEVHAALFRKHPPKHHALRTLKSGIGEHMKAKHAGR